MPQLEIGFYPAQIFWLIISFSILFVAMKFWLLPPIEGMLKAREDKVKSILRQADKLSAKAERIEKEYQQYVADATQYSARILQTAHDEIAADYAAQEEKLLKQLKNDTQNAEMALQEQQNKVLASVKEITYNFMSIFLKKLYRLSVSPKSTQAQIARLIKEKEDG